MPSIRDDFTKDTKDRAASRVGYMCSKPDCRCNTIGPSAESNKSVSNIGVAAHICAAASGGKRYDSTMTPEERKSIDNCIWLCQTHAHLIDTDEKTYSVELLKQWKKEAEEYAAKTIADGNFLKNYYSGNKEDLSQLEELFKSLIGLGEFFLMEQILSQYTSSLSEKYDECILRNRIIKCVYCDRNRLAGEIDKYHRLLDKSGVDDLLRLFIAFGMINELKELRDYCSTKDLKLLIDLVIDGDLADIFLGKKQPAECIEVSRINKDALDKYRLYLLCGKTCFGTFDRNELQESLANAETYWSVLWKTYSIVDSVVTGSDTADNIALKFDPLLKKVQDYDPIAQSLIWDMALYLTVPNEADFERLYQLCPEDVRNTKQITSAKYEWTIRHEFECVNADELLAYCSSIEDYTLLINYCTKLDSQNECAFLEEHQYLYKRDSRFLFRRLVVHDDTLMVDPNNVLEKYKDDYSGDFLFDCLLADLSTCDKTKQDALVRLKETHSGIPLSAIRYYGNILRKNMCWEALIALSENSLPAGILHYLADCLTSSPEEACQARGITIYENLIASDYESEHLHNNLAVAYIALGRIEDAKKELIREYDKYHSDEILYRVLALRYETNEFWDDAYLRNAQEITTWQMQNIVGVHYEKMGQYDKARDGFLRSLLIKEHDNQSVMGYWNICRKQKVESPTRVEVNTAFSIKNDEETLQFALHPPKILEKLSPNEYAGFNHYSSQNAEVAMFMFCRVGEVLQYNGKRCEIIKIEHIDTALSRYALSQIMKQPSTQVVSGASPEEGLAQITEIMKNHKESHEAILSNYNEMDIRLPLSCLAYQFGKTRLNTWEFLSYQNDKPVRNNTAFPNDCTKKLYILTYDSIMTLSRMDSLKISEDITLYCPAQVKNQLVLDINEELEQLEEEESVGQMHYTDAGLRFTELTDELRRNRYKVLVKLKDFVANLVEEPPINLVSDDANMRSFVTEANLRCETGALALAQKIQGGILITDDQFLYCTANFLGICNAGVAFLIAQMSSECKELLEAADELKDLNFQNYFPYGLYKTAFDMSYSDDIIQNRTMLWEWLTKEKEEPIDQHREIVIELFKEVLQSGEDYLNPENTLGHLAIHFYESLHPGFIESLIKKALKDMRIEVK